jgi:pyruvate/2-oxoglutarate/acetoin dehydrogenase E1 component
MAMTTVLEALQNSLASSMQACEEVVFVGEDVLDPYGGAFKVARGLSSRYPERVITTPVSEAGIVGLGVGMALRGLRPVVEIMFGDFLTLATDQLINHAAKLRWMSNDQVRVPLVVRTPMGGRRGYGPTHSQTLEKHFLGVPGLRILAVCDLDDPAELLRRAIVDDDDPVVFIEHKLLYPASVLAVDGIPEFRVERLGSGYPTYRLRVDGAPDPSLTLAAYGHMSSLARTAVLKLAYEHEIFAELMVFTQLSPVPQAPLLESLVRPKRLLTLEEAPPAAGWGAELVALATEHVGPGLVGGRVGAKPMPVPAAGPLEEAVLPDVDDIVEAAVALMKSTPRG